MNTTSLCESERRNLRKLQNIHVPHRFKLIGSVLVAISLGILVALKIGSSEQPVVRYICRHVLLIGLLLIR